MNSSHSQKQGKVICSCSGTTEEKVRQLLANGANNLDKIASATGAATGCGSCDATILQMIEQERKTTFLK